MYDDLTKTYGRKYLYDNFDSNKVKYLLFIDIDDFKAVNDTFGHGVGDKILVKITNRINKLLSGDSYLVRYGGDEFVVIFDQDCSDIDKTLKQFVTTISKKIYIANHIICPSFSVGAVDVTKFKDDVDELITFADIAMYDIKRNGKNDYKIFTKTDYYNYNKKLSYKEPLIKAIKNNELNLLLVPRYYIKNKGRNDLHSYSTRLVWHHENDEISGDKLFEIAEYLGLGYTLSEYSLKTFKDYLDTFGNYLIKNKPIILSMDLKNVNHFEMISDFYSEIDSKYKSIIILRTSYKTLIKLHNYNLSVYLKLILNNVKFEIVDSHDLKLNALASELNIYSIVYSESAISLTKFQTLKTLLNHLDICVITSGNSGVSGVVVEAPNNKKLRGNYFHTEVTLTN